MSESNVVEHDTDSEPASQNEVQSTTEKYATVADNASQLYEINMVEGVTMPAASTFAMAKEHERRIKHLHDQCKEVPNLTNALVGRANMSDFYASTRYKFAYCKVPKSGSTFWMQLFMVSDIMIIASNGICFILVFLLLAKYHMKRMFKEPTIRNAYQCPNIPSHEW